MPQNRARLRAAREEFAARSPATLGELAQSIGIVDVPASIAQHDLFAPSPIPPDYDMLGHKAGLAEEDLTLLRRNAFGLREEFLTLASEALRPASISRPLSGEQDIAQIGTISANGDAEIGNLISMALDKIGPDGVVTVEEARGLETELHIVEGTRFDEGYLSPYFITNPERMIVELENPYILLHSAKLTNLKPLLPVLEMVVRAGRPLLIIAEDIEGEALATLVVNKLRGGLQVAAVKAPGFGDRRRELMEDISILSGGALITEESGIKLETVELGMLGEARRVIVDRENTLLIDARGDIEAISALTHRLRHQIQDAGSEDQREKLRQRLGRISSGVAVVKVGGASEVEVRERKDRVEDAIHATRAAIDEGIVPGGGAALLYATFVLEGLTGANADQNHGIEIVRKALSAPARQIAENAGADGAVVVARLLQERNPERGFDAVTESVVDLVASGIIDPTKVVRTALQDAASVAGLLITTEAAIAQAPSIDPVRFDLRGRDMRDSSS
ncbi:MAG: chaperonin GroEL [Erythrobacter sp.]|nr:chaperonin GroEL [Erythrobacter sp.]